MSALDSQRFKALGQEWEIRFDFNAICEIEEQTGEKFMVVAAPLLALVEVGDIADDASMLSVAQRVDFANVRQLLFWALEGAHPEIDIKTAGSIVQALGLPRSVEVIVRAIARALPTGEGEPGGTENPPKKAGRKPRRKAAKAG